MKRNFLVVLVSMFAVAATLMIGCGKDKSQSNSAPVAEPQLTDRIAVKLSSNLSGTQRSASRSITKVANDQWETGDTVGLFMTRAYQSWWWWANYAYNVKLTPSGGNLIPETPLYYPDNDSVDFVAYYPYTSIIIDTSIHIYLRNQSSQLAQEVLYSNNVKNQWATPSTVTLIFNYTLAKLNITVTNSDAAFTSQEIADMDVAIFGIYSDGSLWLPSGDVNVTGYVDTIVMHKTGNTATSASFEALVFPTLSGYNNNARFAFNIGGNSYTYQVPSNEKFEAAKNYNMTFNLSDTRVPVRTNSMITPRDTVEKIISVNIGN